MLPVREVYQVANHSLDVKILKRSTFWLDALRTIYQNRMAVVGSIFVFFVLALGIFGPMISPYAFDFIDWEAINQPPSRHHWCGTDALGRDLCTRLFHGARVSLSIGLLATLVSVFIGVTWGTLAAFVGGRVDGIMMRIVDILYALPFMFFVILLMAFFGRNYYILFIALGAVQWLTMSRIVRGQVLNLKHQEFVDAARALGVRQTYIVARHILRNTLGPVIVYATLLIPAVILEEAFLSFLGLGVQPPQASWGTLVNDGAKSIDLYSWQLYFPAMMLCLTLLSLNFVGDGLRDALDPRRKR